MREERLKVLKRVADELQVLNKKGDSDFIKKVLFPLEKTNSQSSFREKLRELMKKVLLETNKALFTSDEFVFDILPNGESWRETKDILLIALYEKLSFEDIDEELKEEFENLKKDIGDEDEQI